MALINIIEDHYYDSKTANAIYTKVIMFLGIPIKNEIIRSEKIADVSLYEVKDNFQGPKIGFNILKNKSKTKTKTK